MTNHELEELYGQAFAYSDHKRGERVAYTDSETGTQCSGVIVWVCAPGQLVADGREHPVRYIVLRDESPGFADTVYPGEIIEE